MVYYACNAMFRHACYYYLQLSLLVVIFTLNYPEATRIFKFSTHVHCPDWLTAILKQKKWTCCNFTSKQWRTYYWEALDKNDNEHLFFSNKS